MDFHRKNLRAMLTGAPESPRGSHARYDEFIFFLPVWCDLGAAYVNMGSYETPPPFLCQYPGPSEEVEGQLPEKGVQGILDQPGEPGSMSVMMQMANAEILFDDVPGFGDGLIPLYLIGGQSSAPRSFSHNAVLDIVKAEKLSVILSKVALVGKDLLDRILSMTTAGDTQREKGAIVEGGRCHFRGQDKAITGIDGGMLFQAKVRLVVLDRPVGIEIAGKLYRLTQRIQAALRRFSFDLFFPQLVLAEGMAGGLHQSGIDGDALVDG